MKRDFGSLKQSFDLLVIGGGIYGAWVAYEAALSGLKVALVEKSDWASETSSRSSKLIHGGLRYLENFQISVIKKSLNERKRFLKMAPYRVYPLRFFLPVYKSSTHSRLALKCGLWFYDMLGGTSISHKYHSLENIKQEYPFLKEEGLKGGFSYLDCKTDDARLTLEIIAGAVGAGVSAVNYVKAVSLIKKGESVCGAVVKDIVSGEQIELESRVVVNASGIFLSHLSGVESTLEKSTCLSKGVHLVMPSLGVQDAFIFSARLDNRAFFCIPWYGRTLLGTTDTFWNSSSGAVEVADSDVDYLLDEVNNYLKIKWNTSDVLASFAGVRVLLKQNDSSASNLAREWSLVNPCRGLYVSVGGKLTSSRLDAEKIIGEVCRFLGVLNNKVLKNQSDLFPWSPGGDYVIWKAETLKRGYGLGLDMQMAESLAMRYGSSVEFLFAILEKDQSLKERIDPDFPFCRAEIIHAVTGEMAHFLEDILRRRIPLAILTPLDEKTVSVVADIAGKLLGWDEGFKKNEILKYFKIKSDGCRVS